MHFKVIKMMKIKTNQKCKEKTMYLLLQSYSQQRRGFAVTATHLCTRVGSCYLRLPASVAPGNCKGYEAGP